MDESVVEGGEEMNDTEDVLVLSSSSLGRSVVGNLLFLLLFSLLNWLHKKD